MKIPRKMSDFVSTLNQGAMILDREGVVVFCASWVEELLGSGQKILMNSISSLPSPELVEFLQQDDSNLLLLTIDGVSLSIRRTPISFDSEEASQMILFEDVTPIKKGLDELNVFHNIFEKLYDGIIVVDQEGYTTMISDAYCDFLGVRPSDTIGKHVTEVIENTRMHIVLKTGQAEVGVLQKIKGHEAVVVRIPFIKRGQVVGGVGQVMFRNVTELGSLAKRLNAVESKLRYYRDELKRTQGAKYTFENIIGNSHEMVEVRDLAVKVSKTSSTVLIQGESGTGKELFAHSIHEASPRADAPFVRLNCAAIPKELMESELFGYEEGAFTGAVKGGRTGKIEIASGGSLFLDEIANMPLEMQAKLLRFLQEKEVQRVGGSTVRAVDVRIMAATNCDLEKSVQQGKFREDLYYRLNVVSIRVPPLRVRSEDILTIAQYILGKLNSEMGTMVNVVSPDVEGFFQRYTWPGNVRELHNVIERAINVAEGNSIEFDHLPIYLKEWSTDEVKNRDLIEEGNVLMMAVEDAQKKTILNVLKKCNGNRAQAAKYLGIHRTSLYRKMEQYHIS
jgi:PAS domain S-box-containing protein